MARRITDPVLSFVSHHPAIAIIGGLIVALGVLKVLRRRVKPACPACHSKHVRRSHRKNFLERALSLVFIRPYRCDECMRRFWKLR